MGGFQRRYQHDAKPKQLSVMDPFCGDSRYPSRIDRAAKDRSVAGVIPSSFRFESFTDPVSFHADTEPFLSAKA